MGTLVTGSIYRNPAFLIKQITTLDVLSRGRAWMGIGASWFEKEAKAYGFKFGDWTYRFNRLEEILRIAKQMWSDDNHTFYGDLFQLAETICQPQPISDPHPSIMIGGMGETKTLRYVAEYADACNLFMRAGVETLKHKLDVLKQHCEDIGRDYDEIQKTFLGTVDPLNTSTDEIISEISKYKHLGFDMLIVNMPNIHEMDPIHTLNDEVIPGIFNF